MRIQTSEMLATPDVEMVLRALEWSLREVSIEVARDGERITVRGLGPSQRTMNRNDVTVVDVTCENHHTIVRADIMYQASALLGGISQDDLVRSKLDRVLDRVKVELGTESVRVEAVSWFNNTAPAPEYMIEPAYAVEQEASIEPEKAIEPEHAAEAVHGLESEANEKSEQFVEVLPEAEPVVEPGLIVESAPIVIPEPVIESTPIHESESVSEPASVREPEPEVVVERHEPVVPPVVIEKGSVAEEVEKPVPVAVSSLQEKLADVPM